MPSPDKKINLAPLFIAKRRDKISDTYTSRATGREYVLYDFPFGGLRAVSVYQTGRIIYSGRSRARAIGMIEFEDSVP